MWSSESEDVFESIVNGDFNSVVSCMDHTSSFMIVDKYESRFNRVLTYNPIIHIACRFGSFEIFKYLFDTFTRQTTYDIDLKDNRGSTLLLIASMHGNTDIVKILRSYNANPNIPDNNGSIPLWKAVEYGHHDIVNLLLQDDRVNINQVDCHGNTCLHMLCQVGLFEETEPSDLTSDDYSRQLSEGKLLTLELLLSQPNIDLTIKNDEGETPLDIAILFRRTKYIQALITCSERELCKCAHTYN